MLTDIRRATHSDHAAICCLAEEINSQHYAHSPHVFSAPPGIERDADFWRVAIDDGEGILLLAVREQRVVGLLRARMLLPAETPFLRSRAVCHIGTVVVTASLQGQGIGKLLLDENERWARGKAAEEIRLEVFDANGAAIGFYDAAGFGMQSHIMTKALVP
ncbi:GNAT family N-acetyltransferase [Actimicrobium sp. CCC2.4]|uniref:GNAT family N-acetyltransferase n=1 Tax=Actimicrobium sp. CCC2.4 TaxID=3048606 RepID=UPI002AC9BB16|nr:GNAT family N-acetyltransferase [Actimicrobium sp. CCC2.4]MEB0136969.1 GNAT family N-acetyltransferase [Actimicrobium sp. CCC2.4]WPX32741.1 GNAT family N-acetyltransferase [Actimicrobium sp. CCC2.4]